MTAAVSWGLAVSRRRTLRCGSQWPGPVDSVAQWMVTNPASKFFSTKTQSASPHSCHGHVAVLKAPGIHLSEFHSLSFRCKAKLQSSESPG